jgi:uncharacterized membrane protein HdeD (DUF308 family)
MMASIEHGAQAGRDSRPPRVGVFIYGIVLLLAGAAALLMPLIASFTAGALFGALLLVAGVTGLAAFIADRHSQGAGWRAVWSGIAVVAGACVLWHPWMGALSIGLLISLALIAQGVAATFHAMAHRTECGRAWGWMAAAGVLTAILGVLLFGMFPHASLVIPGFFLAFGLLSYGFTLIFAAFAKTPTSA